MIPPRVEIAPVERAHARDRERAVLGERRECRRVGGQRAPGALAHQPRWPRARVPRGAAARSACAPRAPLRSSRRARRSRGRGAGRAAGSRFPAPPAPRRSRRTGRRSRCPSSPWRVTTASLSAAGSGAASTPIATRLSGAPAKRARNTSLQAISTPTFIGASGASATPVRREDLRPRTVGAPSAARTRRRAPGIVASARTRVSPSGVSTTSAPSPAKPIQRARETRPTPMFRSRASQARSSGLALKLFGNTRPEEPTKVGSPSPSAQSRRSPGAKARIASADQSSDAHCGR